MPRKDLATLASPNVDRYKNPKITNFSPLWAEAEQAEADGDRVGPSRRSRVGIEQGEGKPSDAEKPSLLFFFSKTPTCQVGMLASV